MIEEDLVVQGKTNTNMYTFLIQANTEKIGGVINFNVESVLFY